MLTSLRVIYLIPAVAWFCVCVCVCVCVCAQCVCDCLRVMLVRCANCLDGSSWFLLCGLLHRIAAS